MTSVDRGPAGPARPVRETVVRMTDGFPIAVQESGPADAPAMILLAGQANSHRWWDGLRDAYGRGYRTLTMDFRGTGGSRGPVDAWTSASFADDVAAVLEATGAGPALVLGTSMGGRVAQHLAARRGDLVSALVLACTSPGGEHGLERSMELRRTLGRSAPRERRRLLHELFYTPAWPHPPEASRLLGDRTLEPAETAAHLRVSDRHDAWDDLPRITAPTLVLHGDDDRMTPTGNAPLLAGRVPGAELRLVPGGRHGFFEEFADDVVPAVRAFALAAVPGAGPTEDGLRSRTSP